MESTLPTTPPPAGRDRVLRKNMASAFQLPNGVGGGLDGVGNVFGHGRERGSDEADDDDLPAREMLFQRAVAEPCEDDGEEAGEQLAAVAVELVGALVGVVDEGGEREIKAAVGVGFLRSKRLHGGELARDADEIRRNDVGLRSE